PVSVPGCLFDRRLCSQQEVCVQDGLFGQCQESAARDWPYFQVTSPVLQRLQAVLHRLTAQGLSWQDDITQDVISQEMERIPRLPPPPAREPAQLPPPTLPIQGNLDSQSPEPPALLGRAPAQPSQALFGASPIPSYGGQPGLDGGRLFQDLGMLYLPREKASRLAPASTKAQHGHGLPPDYAEPDEENRQQEAALDAALQRLVAVLADYGVGLQDLSPQQLGSLSALLQLLQGAGGRQMRDASTAPSTLGRAACSLWGGGEYVAPSSPHALDAFFAPGAVHEPWLLESPWGSQPVPELRPSLLPSRSLDFTAGVRLLEILAEHLHLSTTSFINISVVGPALTFQIRQNHQNLSLADVTNQAAMVKSELEAELGLKIVQTGVGQRNEAVPYPHPSHFGDAFHSVLLTFLALACVAGAGIAGAIAVCLRQHAKQRQKDRLAALGPEGSGDSTLEYQELCRQHMATKSLFGRAEAPPAPAENSRVSSVSSQFSDAPQASPSSHSSTPSWCEEPVQSNMDISTGHMILAYMEDHLRNRDRLAKEWQALCAYQAEPSVCAAARSDANLKKNRNPDYVPYDHARIKLKAESNPSRSDFINASPIIEHDPRMPAYIATQGPLSHTIADFWQMVWENGCTVIVMLSPLLEDSVKQCDRYWPDEGSSLYHIYEVNLVSEHIWCEDFLVRSFYLKNVQSQETRTLTQFHFLSWPADGIPTTTRPLLDFRRKVNKCYRGRSCPVIVHCSDGAGRTGTYILIDMVLNRMAKGVKEIDIAATLEHVRDQRPGMVQTKDQFEFALTAVAEEVNAILKALPQ
uniref:Protein tyrosine phosphatase receptor type N n=1 Tax=Gopherus evgoodei TaxID=1825980 RepID=A0A8C4WMK9_9SAUR